MSSSWCWSSFRLSFLADCFSGATSPLSLKWVNIRCAVLGAICTIHIPARCQITLHSMSAEYAVFRPGSTLSPWAMANRLAQVRCLLHFLNLGVRWCVTHAMRHASPLRAYAIRLFEGKWNRQYQWTLRCLHVSCVGKTSTLESQFCLVNSFVYSGSHKYVRSINSFLHIPGHMQWMTGPQYATKLPEPNPSPPNYCSPISCAIWTK